MSFTHALTDRYRSIFTDSNYYQNNKSVRKYNPKIELEDNYYENLFLEEMEFKLEPKKKKIPRLIRKYCKCVEYFSSLEENKKAKQYKTLIDLFLNNPTVVNILEGIENTINNNSNNTFMKKYIISNKIRKLNNAFVGDNIKFNYDKLKNIFNEKEYKKFNNLINNKENLDINRLSFNLINEEIKNQHNNFQKNLKIKKKSLNKREKRGKSLNENKIIQSIKNAFINEKYGTEKKSEERQNSIIKISQQITEISPIKIEKPMFNNQNKLNSKKIIFSNSNNPDSIINKENINNLNIIINKKNTSEFEPLTPININEIEQSEENNKNKNVKSIKYTTDTFEEINETNDFSLNNDNETEENKNKSQYNISLIRYNDINSNETNDSYNIDISNVSNTSSMSNNLNDSIYKKNILKSFRLDFNDLFELIKQSHTISNKQRFLCKEIKTIIENYIIDYNKYLNEKILTKLVNKFSNIWEEMFNNYVKISEIYDNEIKKNDEKINNLNEDEKTLKELTNISENLKNEKENEINKLEDTFSSKIEVTSLDLKNNYNNIDKGLLILNEKFSLIISKTIYDIINNL